VRCHIRCMDIKHPHNGATYAIFRLNKSTFGVKVEIPGTSQVTVTGLGSEADAETWVVRHKANVAKGRPRRGRFIRSQPK
jgi:hypothetical protein